MQPPLSFTVRVIPRNRVVAPCLSIRQTGIFVRASCVIPCFGAPQHKSQAIWIISCFPLRRRVGEARQLNGRWQYKLEGREEEDEAVEGHKVVIRVG